MSSISSIQTVVEQETVRFFLADKESASTINDTVANEVYANDVQASAEIMAPSTESEVEETLEKLEAMLIKHQHRKDERYYHIHKAAMALLAYCADENIVGLDDETLILNMKKYLENIKEQLLQDDGTVFKRPKLVNGVATLDEEQVKECLAVAQEVEGDSIEVVEDTLVIEGWEWLCHLPEELAISMNPKTRNPKTSKEIVEYEAKTSSMKRYRHYEGLLKKAQKASEVAIRVLDGERKLYLKEAQIQDIKVLNAHLQVVVQDTLAGMERDVAMVQNSHRQTTRVLRENVDSMQESHGMAIHYHHKYEAKQAETISRLCAALCRAEENQVALSAKVKSLVVQANANAQRMGELEARANKKRRCVIS